MPSPKTKLNSKCAACHDCSFSAMCLAEHHFPTRLYRCQVCDCVGVVFPKIYQAGIRVLKKPRLGAYCRTIFETPAFRAAARTYNPLCCPGCGTTPWEGWYLWTV